MIALFSDVHANPYALEAVLEDMAQRGAEKLYFLGDVLSGPDPAGTMEILYDSGCTAIAGNVEKWVIDGDIDIAYDDELRIAVSDKMKWIRDVIDPKHLEWIMGWPMDCVVDGMYFVHDSHHDRVHEQSLRDNELDDGYLFHAEGLYSHSPDEDFEKNRALCVERNAQNMFFGHTHCPHFSHLNGFGFYNVGSVGFCFGEDPRPCWVSWDGESAALHRITYDMTAVINLIRTTDYYFEDREAYISMIQTGRHWREFLKPDGELS